MAPFTTPRKLWLKVRPSGWICDDGRYIARFKWGKINAYLLYKNKKEYEKLGADYLTFFTLKDAKNFFN